MNEDAALVGVGGRGEEERGEREWMKMQMDKRLGMSVRECLEGVSHFLQLPLR